ncbi:hypothetical protein KSC_086800 [Ktedonobacter sp. SOSP1-52]|uniref:hypothetical protein n=1 Tax=Ktedonobacter sp. SOSP1-52 TaxID=2778366 RepID=UPI001916A28F|nr:hypothetical protein [Ktedonobacter sp. SOSP1-52]GHO69788.1 hypothetical protein KSC_086800 [Ktedonobacter sp. SOSP1-52]
MTKAPALDERLLYSPPELKAVGSGPDTFSVNFKFAGPDGKPNGDTLSDTVVQRLEEWLHLAREEHEDVPTDMVFRYALGDEQIAQTLKMRPHGYGVWSWLLYCDDLKLSMGHGSLNGGVFCQARFSSHLLWTLGAEQATVALESTLYDLLGSMLYQQSSELHICLDVQGLDFASLDWQRAFVSRVTRMRERPEVPMEEELEGGLSPAEVKRLEENIKQGLIEQQHSPIATTEHRRLATLDFGSHASALSAQIYNKSREIKKHRKEWFEPIWHSNGWDGHTTVWRIEFRFRRRFLADFELNEAFETLDNIQALWAYATTEWLRYVDLDASQDSNKSRIPTHPCWEFVQKGFGALDDVEPMDEQAQLACRLENLVEEKPLQVLENVAALNLDRQLFDETALAEDDLSALTEMLQEGRCMVGAGHWWSWVLEMVQKPVYKRILDEYRGMRLTLGDESADLLRELAREHLATLSPDQVKPLVLHLSSEPFQVVRARLVRRKRRMAKLKACIAGVTGYMRSAVALSGDEIPIRDGHGTLPSFTMSMAWLFKKIEEYDSERGRVHMEEVFKKRLAYGFVTAEKIEEERRLYGVDLHKEDWSKIDLILDDARRRNSRAAASDAVFLD